MLQRLAFVTANGDIAGAEAALLAGSPADTPISLSTRPPSPAGRSPGFWDRRRSPSRRPGPCWLLVSAGGRLASPAPVPGYGLGDAGPPSGATKPSA